MLSIFICEDDHKYRQQVTKVIDNYTFGQKLQMEVVCSTDSPDELINYLSENEVAGLYFLDLDLGPKNINGIELAQKIREYDPRGFIVFITTDGDSHQLTFKYKVEAMDYIVKGDLNTKERIHQCIDNAIAKLTAKATPLQDNLFIKLAGNHNSQLVSLERSKILYIETSPNTRNIIINTETSRYESRETLKQFQKQLDSRFVVCHRSFIVNIDKISSYDKTRRVLNLVNGDSVSVSKLYAISIESKIKKHSGKFI